MTDTVQLCNRLTLFREDVAFIFRYHTLSGKLVANLPYVIIRRFVILLIASISRGALMIIGESQ